MESHLPPFSPSATRPPGNKPLGEGKETTFENTQRLSEIAKKRMRSKRLDLSKRLCIVAHILVFWIVVTLSLVSLFALAKDAENRKDSSDRFVIGSLHMEGTLVLRKNVEVSKTETDATFMVTDTGFAPTRCVLTSKDSEILLNSVSISQGNEGTVMKTENGEECVSIKEVGVETKTVQMDQSMHVSNYFRMNASSFMSESEKVLQAIGIDNDEENGFVSVDLSTEFVKIGNWVDSSSSAAFIMENGNVTMIVNGGNGAVHVGKGLVDSDPMHTCVGTLCFEGGLLSRMVMVGMNGVEISAVNGLLLGHSNRTASNYDMSTRFCSDVESCSTCVITLENIQSKKLDSFSQIWDVGHGNLSFGGGVWVEGPAMLEAGHGASGSGDGSIPRGDGGMRGSGGNIIISGGNVTFCSEERNLFKSRRILIAGGKLFVGARRSLNLNEGNTDLEWPFGSLNVHGETVIGNRGLFVHNQTALESGGGDTFVVVSQVNDGDPVRVAIRGDVARLHLGGMDRDGMPVGAIPDAASWALGCSILHNPDNDKKVWIANGTVSVRSVSDQESSIAGCHADFHGGNLHMVGSDDTWVVVGGNSRSGIFWDAGQSEGSFRVEDSDISLSPAGISLNAVAMVEMNVAQMVAAVDVSVGQHLNFSSDGVQCIFSGENMEVNFSSGNVCTLGDLTLKTSGNIVSSSPDIVVHAGSSRAVFPASVVGSSMEISFDESSIKASTKDVLTFHSASFLRVQFESNNNPTPNMTIGNLVVENCTLFLSGNESISGPVLDTSRAIVSASKCDGPLVTVYGDSGVNIVNVLGTFVSDLVLDGSGMLIDFQQPTFEGKNPLPLVIRPSLAGKVMLQCMDSELRVGDGLILASGIMRSNGVTIDYSQSVLVGENGAPHLAFESTHHFVVLDTADFHSILEGSFSLMANDADLFTLSLADSRVISSETIAFVADGSIVFTRKNSAIVEVFVGNTAVGNNLHAVGGEGTDQSIHTSSTRILLSGSSSVSAVSGQLFLKSCVDNVVLSSGKGCSLGVSQRFLSTDGRLLIEMDDQILRTTSGAMMIAGDNSLGLTSGASEVTITRRDGVGEPLTVHCGAASAGAVIRRPSMVNMSSSVTDELMMFESSCACDLCGDAAPFVVKSGDAMDVGVGGHLVLSGGSCDDCHGGCVLVRAGVGGGMVPSNVSMSCAMLHVKSLENESDDDDLLVSDVDGIRIGGLRGEHRNLTRSTKIRSRDVHLQGGLRVQLFNGEELFGFAGHRTIEIGTQTLSNVTETLAFIGEEVEWTDQLMDDSFTLCRNAMQINRTSISILATNVSIGTASAALNRTAKASFRGEHMIFNSTTTVVLGSSSRIIIGAGVTDVSAPITNMVTMRAADLHFWIHCQEEFEVLKLSTDPSLDVLDVLYHETLINVTSPSDGFSSFVEVGSPFEGDIRTESIAVSGNTVRLDSSMSGGSSLKMNGSNFVMNCQVEKVRVSSSMNVQPGFKWKESGPDLIPPGAVMFFRKKSCPSGWTFLAGSDGFVVMGMTEYPGQDYDDLSASLKQQGVSRGHGTSTTVDLLTHTGTSGTTVHNHGFTTGSGAGSTSATFSFDTSVASPGHSHTGTTDSPSHSHGIPQQDISHYHYDICPVVYLIACIKD
jgi:hypothetical protein